MRQLLIFFLCFLFHFVSAQVVRVIDQPLSTVIAQLEKDYNYLFSYMESDIKDITVSANINTENIEDLLKILLSKTDLKFEIVDKNYIILSSETTSESTIEQGKDLRLLCGQVNDKVTGQPLSFANVMIQNSSVGTSTAYNGRFELKTNFTTSDSITISYVGYQEKRLPIANFYAKDCPIVSLDYLDYDDNFVVVTDYLTDGIQLNNNSSYTNLNPDKIGVLPGQAEPDLLQTIHFLPGVSSPDGTAAGINIRGGAAGENLTLWEQIPVYHTAHYFGMISAFNPYIINEAQVYRGGFSANYGGRVSGVIDLKSNPYVYDENTFGAGINFLNAYTYGKFKTAQKRLNITYSLRRSISDLWRSPTYNSITRRIHQGVLFEIPIINKIPDNYRVADDFQFLDGHLKGDYQLSDHSSIGFAAFYGTNVFSSSIMDDLIKSKQDDNLDLNNSGFRLRWQQQWQSGLSNEILALQSEYSYNYHYDLISQERPTENKSGIKDSRICERQLQFNNKFRTKLNHVFRAGYHLQSYDVDFQITKNTPDTAIVDEKRMDESLVHVLYSDFSTDADKKLGTEVGLRWSYFTKGEKGYFEPRLRLWYQPIRHLQLYANAGYYYQFLNQLIEFAGDESSIQTPVWVLSGKEEVPILRSEQYQIGAVWQKKTLLIDVQVYYKNINGLTSLSSNFTENLATRFHLGNANVRGIDVLIKKRWGKFRSWVSYSYSDIDHEFPTFFDRHFPASIEQPHQLHWVNTYEKGDFSFSLGWKLASGTPYSDRDNFRINRRQSQQNQSQFTELEPIVNQLNSNRLPLQHQLDASINYTYLPKGKQRWKAVFGCSIINLYNQQNLYNRGFFISSKREQGSGQDQNQLQIRYLDRANLGFTPNAVIRLEW